MAVAAVLVACGAAGLGGCSSGTASGGAPATTTTEVPDGGSSQFCVLVDAGPKEVPESYVGSPANLAAVEALLAVAPPEIAGDVATYRAYLASGAITDDPDTKDVENFPPDVRQAVTAVRGYIATTC